MSPLKKGQLVIVIKSNNIPHIVGKIGEVTSNKQVHKVYDPITGVPSEFVGYSVRFPSPVFYSIRLLAEISEVVFPRENLKPISDPDADVSDSVESDWKIKPPVSIVSDTKVTNTESI